MRIREKKYVEINYISGDQISSLKNGRAKDLGSHAFDCYLVCYQTLLTSHIWLVKPALAIFFCLIFARQTFDMQILVANYAIP